MTVGEVAGCRENGGRRACRLPRPPGDGSGGALPVVRIDIDGVGCALAPLADEMELDGCAGGVATFAFTGIGGKYSPCSPGSAWW